MQPGSLASHFAVLKDPRTANRCRHKFLDIVIMAVLGALCGMEHWTEVEFFAKHEAEWLGSFLELPGGAPSHDTFGRVFALMDPKAFTAVFLDWVNTVKAELPGDIIALDGIYQFASVSEGYREVLPPNLRQGRREIAPAHGQRLLAWLRLGPRAAGRRRKEHIRCKRMLAGWNQAYRRKAGPLQALFGFPKI